MSKYNSKNIWGAVVSILVLLAIIGPWWFDRVNVPAQYPCNRPFVRLEGDFCGMPMTGAWIPVFVGARFIELAQRIHNGEIALGESIPMILQTCLFALFVILLIMPLILPWVVIVKGDNKRLHWLQVASLVLATCIGWIFGFGLINSQKSLALWGSWLYLGVVTVALIVEVVMPVLRGKVYKVYQ